MAGLDDNGLTDLLYAVSQDAPPSRVDLDVVRAGGRRRRRRRAVVTPVLVAASIVGLAGGGLAVASLAQTRPQPVPPGTAGPSTSPTMAATPSPPPPLAEFPVDRQIFALGETFGRDLKGVRLSSSMQVLTYGDGRYGDVSVWVFAAGADGARELLESGMRRAPVPAVRGLPATYLYPEVGDGAAGPDLAGIEFQWTSGAWGLILRSSAPDLDEARLAELAAGLRADVDEPMLFPFTVSAPVGLRQDWAGRTSESAGTGEWELWFGLDGAAIPAPLSDAPRVTVTVAHRPQSPAPGPNATVGDHPAHVVDDDTSYSVTLLDTAYTVNVTVTGAGFAGLFSPEQANALALSVRLVGTADRSQWTDHPIR